MSRNPVSTRTVTDVIPLPYAADCSSCGKPGRLMCWQADIGKLDMIAQNAAPNSYMHILSASIVHCPGKPIQSTNLTLTSLTTLSSLPLRRSMHHSSVHTTCEQCGDTASKVSHQRRHEGQAKEGKTAKGRHAHPDGQPEGQHGLDPLCSAPDSQQQPAAEPS